MRKITTICLASLTCFFGANAKTSGPQGSVAAPFLSDVHLHVLPRTAEDVARVTELTKLTRDFTQSEAFENDQAGTATVQALGHMNAFAQPSGNIGAETELDFKIGNGLFRKLWQPAPSASIASDGLGPLYNARSCESCHLKDGRGHPPDNNQDTALSMLLKVSIPAELTDSDPAHKIEGYLATVPEPTYGAQLQDLATENHPAEYRLLIEYDEIEVPLSGGEIAVLRAPRYEVADLGYGPLHEETLFSPRVAPQMVGLGLLETIPVEDILALADPNDTNGDGVSGRANIVWSAEHQVPMLGRFGMKAGKPTIREQSAAAFSGDIGLSSALFPAPWGDCSEGQPTCREAPHGDQDGQQFEVGQQEMDLIVFYSRNLAVPSRRDVDDPNVLRGKQIFYETGCINCHRPKFVTHQLADQPEQSAQLIWPYTDMLLHDMGEGLADFRPEARANGQEWRTPPLWGIGLTEQVSGHTFFLHDGRARSLLEAVLWHGGEAQPHRDAVIQMPPEDRRALVRFLESL